MLVVCAVVDHARSSTAANASQNIGMERAAEDGGVQSHSSLNLHVESGGGHSVLGSGELPLAGRSHGVLSCGG